MLKTKSPANLQFPTKGTGDGRDERRLLRSGGLNTLARGVQKAAKRRGQVSWLRALCRLTLNRSDSQGVSLIRGFAAILITVARPRGILTRFPILPALRGTPMLCLERTIPSDLNATGHYHANLESVKLRYQERGSVPVAHQNKRGPVERRTIFLAGNHCQLCAAHCGGWGN